MQAATITTEKSMSLPVWSVFSQRSNISVTWPPSIAVNVISTAQRSRVLRTGMILDSVERVVKLTIVIPVAGHRHVLVAEEFPPYVCQNSFMTVKSGIAADLLAPFVKCVPKLRSTAG
jgi:hypothetical protein